MKHLFLTGEKQIGKSTLIGKCLDGIGVPVSGFYTKKGIETDDHLYVHILKAGCDDSFRQDNILFDCRDRSEDAADRFNILGCRILSEQPDAGLIIMDEIGYREQNADRFIGRVMELLDGDTPVFGVLRLCDRYPVTAIRARDDVEIIEVTAENRDELANTLPVRLRKMITEDSECQKDDQ